MTDRDKVYNHDMCLGVECLFFDYDTDIEACANEGWKFCPAMVEVRKAKRELNMNARCTHDTGGEMV